jgi:predicted permease
MNSLGNRLRHVLYRLRRAPAFSLVTVFTLAVGIGANSAIFSVVNAILLKPLPFHDSDRLVGIWYAAPGLRISQLDQGPAFHLTLREESRVFEDVGMWRQGSATVTGLAEPERINTLVVTDGVLSVLRVQPIHGRPFTVTDDSPGTPETVILSYAYWQRRLGGNPAAIGRKLVVEGRPMDVIGVLPQNFKLLDTQPDLLLPYKLNRSEVFVGNFAHRGVARLKPGITLDQANADVARVIPLALQRFPMPPGFTLKMAEEARISPNLRLLKEDAAGNMGRVLWILLGTAGMVLLIACANVANLFLIRTEGRQKELAIRNALGAGWRQIAQKLLSESLTLGMLGGTLGLVLAETGIRLLVALKPQGIPRLEEVSIDIVVLSFTAGIAILASLLFGMFPLLKYGRPNLASVLKEGGRTSSSGIERHRMRNALAVAQIGLALVLLVGSGLMVRTFMSMRRAHPGFERPEEVLTLRISIPSAEVADDEKAIRTHEQIMRRLEQIPGVLSVGLSSSITMDGMTSNDPIQAEDYPVPEGQIPNMRRYKWISENYFATMQNPILFGREITWADIYARAPVLVVTENFAREYWQDPARAVGRRIRENSKAPWRQIIGVAANIYDDGVNQKATAVVYWPMLVKDYWGVQTLARRNMAYAIRSTRVGTPSFFKEVQQAIWSVNRNLPLANVRRLEEIFQDSMARASFTLTMLAIAASVALILGTVGIYGVISYSVSQRTREIGIRMALGAQKGEVNRMFLRQGILLATLGIALGLCAAAGLTRLLSALLYGVEALDLITFAAVALILCSVALLATYLPASRAAKVDPVTALRCE